MNPRIPQPMIMPPALSKPSHLRPRFGHFALISLFAVIAALFGGIASAQNLFVCNPATNSILEFDRSTAAFIRGLSLYNPQDVTIGPDGSVDAVDNSTTTVTYNNGIYTFHTNPVVSNSVTKFNSATGASLGALIPASSVPVNLRWIYIFGTSYNYTVNVPIALRKIAFGPDGSLYVTCDVPSSIDNITYPNTQMNVHYMSQIRRYNGTTGAFLGIFAGTGVDTVTSYYSGLTFASDCSLQVAFANNGGWYIQRYAFAGNYLGASPIFGSNGGGNIMQIAIGPDGKTYCVPYAGSTFVYDSSANTVGGIASTTRGGCAFGPSGSLYTGYSYNGSQAIVYWLPSAYTTGYYYINNGVGGLNAATSGAMAFQSYANSPQNYNTALPFRVTGKSMWSATGPPAYFADYNLTTSWDTGSTKSVGGFYNPCTPSVTIDPCFGLFGGCAFTIPGFCLGDFGGTASAYTKGTAGLKFSAYATAGDVNVNYPVSVSMNFPDRNYLFAGDYFTLKSSYTVDPSANMGTRSPRVGASVNLVLNGQMHVAASAKAFGASIFNATLFPFNIPGHIPDPSTPSNGDSFNFDTTLFNTDSILGSLTTFNYSLVGGAVTGYVKVPFISTSGMPSTTNPTAPITSSGQDTFFSMRGSLSDFVRNAILDDTGIYVPIGSDSIGSHFGAGTGFDAGYSFCDIYATLNLNAGQDFTFSATPHVHLDVLPAGTNVNWIDASSVSHTSSSIDFDAGQNIQIQMPSNPIVQFNATYTLPNSFTNAVSLIIDPSLNFNFLELFAKGSIGGYELGSFDFQPVPVQTLNLATFGISGKIPLYSTTFAMPGFQNVTQKNLTVSGKLHPAPGLSNVSPSMATILIVPFDYNSLSLPTNIYNGGDVYTTLTLKGYNFPTTGNQAYFSINGSTPEALSTTYVDPCTLSVKLPNRYLLIAGNGNFYVTAPNTTGNSNTLPFAIQNPKPAISNAGPNIYAADPNLGGNLLVTVVDPSASYIYSPTYYNKVSSLWRQTFQSTSINSAISAVFPGFDFSAVSPMPAIHWKASDGIDRTLTMYQESQPSGLLWALLPLAYYANPDTAQITVVSPGPGGGTSNAINLLVGYALPQITSLSPTTVVGGSDKFKLTVNGPISPNVPPSTLPYGNFNGASVVYWNGSPRPTKFVSSGQLIADITAADVATGGLYPITVVTTVNNGIGSSPTQVSSAAINFAVKNPLPAVSTLDPGAVISADPAMLGTPNAEQYNITVTGSNFVSDSVIQWNGTVLATQYQNNLQLKAAIPYSYVAAPATANITVFNKTVGGGGGTSNKVSLSITNGMPTLTSLTPSSAQQGGAAFGIGISGTGFYSGSKVYWNGSARTTTFQASNALLVNITAADIANVGTAQITVVNPAPGGGTSTALTFNITGPTLSGSIALDGVADLSAISPSAPIGLITFGFYPPGATHTSATTTKTATLTTTAGSPNGTFFVSGLTPGTYDVGIQSGKSLRKIVSNVTIAANGTTLSGVTTLLGGNGNGDSTVNFDDFLILLNAFGSDATISGSGYDPQGDYNYDGKINFDDFLVLLNNFGTNSDL